MRRLSLCFALFLSADIFAEDITKWINELKSPYPATRQAAADSLAQSGNQSEAVISALHQSLARLPSDQAKDITGQASAACFRALKALAPSDDRTIDVLFKIRARPLKLHEAILNEAYESDNDIKLNSIDQVEHYLTDGTRLQKALAANLLAKKGWALRPAAIALKKLIPRITDGNYPLAHEVIDGIQALGRRGQFLGDDLRTQLRGLLDLSPEQKLRQSLGHQTDRFTELSYGELMYRIAETIRLIDPDHADNKPLFQRLTSDLRFKSPKFTQRTMDLVSAESGKPPASQDTHDRVELREALRIGLSLPPERDKAYVTIVQVLNRASKPVREEVLEEFSRDTDWGRQILFVMAAKEHATPELLSEIQKLSWCGPILQAL